MLFDRELFEDKANLCNWYRDWETGIELKLVFSRCSRQDTFQRLLVDSFIASEIILQHGSVVLSLLIVSEESRVWVGLTFRVICIIEEIEILPTESLYRLKLLVSVQGHVAIEVSGARRFELVCGCTCVALSAVIDHSFFNHSASD